MGHFPFFTAVYELQRAGQLRSIEKRTHVGPETLTGKTESR